MRKGKFDFEDYLESMKQMRNMGGISSILSIVLLVLTLGICFYWLLKIPAQKKCKVLFPRSFVAACGNFVSRCIAVDFENRTREGDGVIHGVDLEQIDGAG